MIYLYVVCRRVGVFFGIYVDLGFFEFLVIARVLKWLLQMYIRNACL